MENDTNYYLILELPLDPPVRDKASLEAAIQKKLTEWNQGVNNPTKGLLYKSLAAKVPEIRKSLLTDDATRETIIAEALRIVKGDVAALIEAVAKSGSMTEAQVKEICKKTPQLSEKTIRKMIKVPIVEKSGSTFKVPPKPADPPIKPTDSMQMDKFEKNLAVLHKKDIYDFLGCSRTSSPDAMCALADEELEKARKAPSKTAEVSARQELAGLITSYFKKKNAKEAYDLALRTFIGQKKLVEVFAIRCVSKTIEWKSYQDSIADCRAIGMSQEEAEYFVYDFYCNKRKCPPPTVPAGEASGSAIHYCRACFAPNPEGASSCQSCGVPFKVKCPKCGKTVDLDNPYCPKCSFPVGDMPLALKLIKEGKLAVAKQDFGKAEKMIDQALVYWPGNPDCTALKADIAKHRAEAKAAEERLRAEAKAAEMRERLRIESERVRLETEKAISAAADRYNNAILAGDWANAEKAAQERARLGDGSADKWHAEIVKEKNERRERLEDHCKKALTDFASSFPANLGEAEAAVASAEAAALALEKEFRSSPEVGRTRASVKSARQKLAERKRDLLVEELPKVESLTAEGSKNGPPAITVSWKRGSGKTSVAKWRVVRRVKGVSGSGMPLGDFDVGKTSFTDRDDLKLGIEYIYEVTPLAKTDDGKFEEGRKAVAQSAPAVCLAKLAPDALNGKGEGEANQWGVVLLTWSLPSGLDLGSGNVKLLLSRKDGRFTNLNVTSYAGAYTDDEVHAGQTIAYTLALVIAEHDSGVSSVEVPILSSQPPEPISNLTVRRGTGVGMWLVKWTWPTGIDKVLLVRSGTETVTPEIAAESTDSQTVKKDEYEARQGAEVFLRPDMSYIIVFSFKEVQKRKRRYSEGVSCHVFSRVQEIVYTIEPHPGGVFREAAPTRIIVRTNASAIPRLLVVAGNGRRPMRVSEGRILCELPASAIPFGGAITTEVASDIQPNSIRLFFADPNADAESFRLAPPRILH